MGDLLAKATGWLESERHKHRTVPVTYERDAASVGLKATVGRTEFELRDDYGMVQKVESRDFLVRTQDLVLGGGLTVPERGDVVREERGSQVFVYEVMAPGKEPAWRYSDPERRTIRIHAKHVATEDAP